MENMENMENMEQMKKQLLYLSKDPQIIKTAIPSKTIEHLKSLKDNGFNPKVIYDIGACVGHWRDIVKSIWADAEVYLFEGNPECEIIYQNKGIKKKYYHIGLLSNEDNKKVNYYFCPKHPGGNSYYQEIGNIHSKEDFINYIELNTSKLSTVCKLKNIPPPDLIKIDVQGAEKDIIKGSEEIIKQTKYLIVEMQHCEYNKAAPRVTSTKPYIEKKLGFICTHERIVGGTFDDDYAFKNKHK
jgi:FkbM family methyltransferase